MTVRRKKGGYFPYREGTPAPLVARVGRRVKFSEVDVMGIAWFGRYAAFFEEGSAELGRLCSLSYEDFANAGLRAPIVQFHTDYHRPLALDEEFTIVASLVWSEGARLNTEYSLIGKEKEVTATAYTVQMLVDAVTGHPCLAPPELLERCRRRWKAGDFVGLK
jgi:acyl-CoA thioester hydrolase